MLQAAFWFAVMALLVKLAGNCGLPTMQIVFARALVTLTLSAIALKQAGLRAIVLREEQAIFASVVDCMGREELLLLFLSE